MNKFFLFVFIISSFYCNSQTKDSFKGRKKPYTCTDLIRISNELSGKSEARLPNEFILSPINFGRIKKDSADVKLLHFYIGNYPYSSSMDGLYLKLANDELIKLPNAKIKTSYSSGSYSLFGGIELTEDLIRKLGENFIVQFSMGDKIVEIEERHKINLQQLFNCMFAD